MSLGEAVLPLLTVTANARRVIEALFLAVVDQLLQKPARL